MACERPMACARLISLRTHNLIIFAFYSNWRRVSLGHLHIGLKTGGTQISMRNIAKCVLLFGFFVYADGESDQSVRVRSLILEIKRVVVLLFTRPR